MFSFFRRTFRRWARSSTRTGAPNATGRRLQCETLEDRLVPSITTRVGLVNATKPGTQTQVATAMSSNGSSVAVWTVAKHGRDTDVMAQRFDAAGRKVGGEIAVATGRNPQHNPSVAMDAAGNFVVAWTHDFAPNDTDVHAARFKADGSRNGNEFIVADTERNEYDPSVGVDARGDFIVSYTYQANGRDLDVKAVLYRSNGTVARTLNVATSSRPEEHSRVAVTADGRFAIAYQSLGNIFTSRYSSTGVRVGAHAVATSPRLESNPSLAMDNAGDVLVVWQQQYGHDWNIYGRKIAGNGKMGNVFAVMATPSIETNPSVAVDPTTGRAVMAYQGTVGWTTRVLVSEFTERQTYVRTSTMGMSLANPSVSAGGPWRRFLVAAQSTRGNGDDWDGGIFSVFGSEP